MMFVGLCGSLLHFWLRLGILEIPIQTLQPYFRRNVWKPSRRQRFLLRQWTGKGHWGSCHLSLLKKTLHLSVSRSAIIRPSLHATQSLKTSLSGKVGLLCFLLMTESSGLWVLTFCLLLDQRWKNKFWGKSVEIISSGLVNVTLPRWAPVSLNKSHKTKAN